MIEPPFDVALPVITDEIFEAYGGGLTFIKQNERDWTSEAVDFAAEIVRPAVQSAHIRNVARIRELEEESDNMLALIQRQGDLLRGVANALHGGPLENGWWSHDDLPEMAQAAMALKKLLLARIEDLEASNETWQQANAKLQEELQKLHAVLDGAYL